MTSPPSNPPPARRDPCWKCGYDLSNLTTSICPECGSGPPVKRDPCWKCGYDLTDLETGVCPECGARFVTGKDLEHLHDRLLVGEHRRCVACGTPRTELGATRCPVCGMRFTRDPDVATAPEHQVGGVTAREPLTWAGDAKPTDPVFSLWRRRYLRLILLLLVLLAALATAAQINQASLQAWVRVLANVLIVALGLSILVIGFAGVLASRRAHAQREAHTNRHCQACGYDLKGLPGPRCPECGVDLPHAPGAAPAKPPGSDSAVQSDLRRA